MLKLLFIAEAAEEDDDFQDAEENINPYEAHVENDEKCVERVFFSKDQNRMSFNDVIEAWQNNDEVFLETFIQSLKDAAKKYARFYWRMPKINTETLKWYYEHAIFQNKSVDTDKPLNTSEYNEYFSNNESVASFSSPSGNTLVVPNQQEAAHDTSGHLAAFVNDDENMNLAKKLFAAVGEQLLRRVNKDKNKYVYVNTCGNDIEWLHVRLDGAPTYYSTEKPSEWAQGVPEWYQAYKY